MKYKLKLKDFVDCSNPTHTFMVGVSTGLVAIGLQNYNPLEPRACTHYCSILAGFLILLLLILTRVVIVGYKQIRDSHKIGGKE